MEESEELEAAIARKLSAFSSRSIVFTFRYSLKGFDTASPKAFPTSTAPSKNADVVAVMGSHLLFSSTIGFGFQILSAPTSIFLCSTRILAARWLSLSVLLPFFQHHVAGW